MSLVVAVLFNLFDGCDTAWIEPSELGGFYGACGDADGREVSPRVNPVSLTIDLASELVAWVLYVSGVNP